MNAASIAFAVTVSLLGAVLLGIKLRALVPAHHLSAESKDAVKLAMGLVATMSALILGLLISSAKGSYNLERTHVIEMAAKLVFLDRVLTLYGPETAPARAHLRGTVEDAVTRIWTGNGSPRERLAAPVKSGDTFFFAIQNLSPENDAQRSLKSQASALAMELGQLRILLIAESVASISNTLLVVVVCWLVVIFLSFSVLAPSNATATLALVVSALSSSGAIFLILELDQPFAGLIRISSEPLVNAISQLGK